MFENFREKLQLVQQDVSTSFKTLGDISRDGKVKRRSRLEENFPHLSAGLGVLSRYEESWFLLHKRTKDCGEAAEAVDGDIVMLSAHWERRRDALTQLHEQFESLPDLISEFDAITASIAHLEGEFEEMESRLVYLETLCSQCDQHTFKKHHMDQLEIYKKKKRKEVDALEEELNTEHAQRLAELEQVLQQKLRERQKVYEDAFNQDVQQYLSTGQLQHRGSAGADLCSLDQVMVTNTSDLEALDNFLNSSSCDISTASSPTSGPDPDSPSSDSLSRAPPSSAPESGLESGPESGQTPAWQQDEASEESDELQVQSDEEDVTADTSLAGLQDDGATWGSDESDCVGERPAGGRDRRALEAL
ncbi:dysbindin-A-like [Cololabis saira]|uniref:dysbindin-A-like n=1 Tax=Cololabis saira TaxID=129043 RepID=UPI002AD212E8|nr:dysbindin-A-like [Cololabis saira]